MSAHWPAVVVGGGITGLYAAHLLARRGHQPVVLEATSHVGGQVRSQPFLGHALELGAESLHTGAPELLDLARARLGGDALVGSSGARTLLGVPGRSRMRLRPLPDGVGPAGPTRLAPLATSRILSPSGLARAAIEPLLPASRPNDDLAVGHLLRSRFGREVTERLLDPVLGNLHGGDVERLSLHATAPALARLAQQHRSLVLARRRARGSGPGAPRFHAIRGGATRLIDTLAADPDVTVRREQSVRALEPTPTGYRIHGETGPLAETGRLLLCVPAADGARLLDTLGDGPDTCWLHQQRSATVASVLVGYARENTPAQRLPGASGVLLPATSGRLLKAATFLSTKWPHLDDGANVLVRLSAGRAGDDRLRELDDELLSDRLHAELSQVLGREPTPQAFHVHRWPAALPQLEIGHVDRMQALRDGLRGHRGLAVAGAAYDGLGLAACVRSAAAAVDHVTLPRRRPLES